MPTHEAQPEPDQSDPSDHSDHSGQSDHSDDNMKDSTRSKALRKSRPPPKRKTRDEPSDAKPLNQNDLVKWIVISDAPDHASVRSKFCNAKSYPVLPRSAKYLERFGARNLRTGLKCLRAMNNAARQENEKLEQEAQVLGCVDGEASSTMDVEKRLGGGEEQHHNTARAVVDDPDSSMQVDASKESRIATLRFNMSFYRRKVLPFIQACLIADGQLSPLPPRTPAALPFPGAVYLAFESTAQRSAAKAAYDMARAGGLPQESCDTAARRRVGVRSQTAAAASLEADDECPPTPGGYKEHDDSIGLQTQTPANGAVAASSPTHSSFPPTPRAPDFSSSPVVAVAVATPRNDAVPDAMNVDADAAGAARGCSRSAPTTTTTTTKPNKRADTPTSPVTTTTTTTATSTPNTLALAAALPFSRSSLRRSTRSTTLRSSTAGAGADATPADASPLPLKDMSVWEMQREILRLCALRERCVARNEVLREWVRGMRGE